MRWIRPGRPFRSLHRGLALACTLTLSSAPVFARSFTFHLTPGQQDSRVVFHSDATLESFDGKTRQLWGEFVVDPDSVGHLRGALLVDLTSFDTGIGLRNQHMRQKVLHTDSYPRATLTIHGAEPGRLAPDIPLKTIVHGDMTLHGQTRSLDVPVTARLRSDGGLEISARFPITLGDYGIQRPRMLMMKVAETVELRVEAVARPGPSPPPIGAPIRAGS